jgi:hypothetical protein
VAEPEQADAADGLRGDDGAAGVVAGEVPAEDAERFEERVLDGPVGGEHDRVGAEGGGEGGEVGRVGGGHGGTRGRGGAE